MPDLSSGLVGREAEWTDVLAALTPEGAVVVIDGEAGIGKTAVWRAVVDVQPGEVRTLVAAGFEGDGGLGYAVLADLLAPLVEEVASLPPGLRKAIESAVLRRKEGEADERGVHAAVLELLRECASAGPLLVAVDDVQWVDEPSALALAFAARRLAEAPVRFLFTRRGDTAGPFESRLARRIRRVGLGPMTDQETARLVSLQVMDLPPARRRAIVEAAAGHPLYALELARMREHGDRLPDGIDELLRARLAQVPDTAREALLAVALSPGLDGAELVAALGASAVDEAATAGLLTTCGPRVVPQHPLLLTAADHGASPAQRRAIHALLADVVDDDIRRARHLALAEPGRDERLAATVGSAASLATSRLERRTAHELAEHALRLTPARSPARARRLLDLAEHALAAGHHERCSELLADLTVIPTGVMRARACLLRVEAAPESSDRVLPLLDQATREAGDDPIVASLTLANRAAMQTRAMLGDPAQAEHWALTALDLAGDNPTARQRARTELAWARIELGHDIDDLLDAELHDPGPPPRITDSVARVAALQQIWRGELSAAHTALDRLLAESELRGEGDSTYVILTHLCEVATRSARWDQAEEYSLEREHLPVPHGRAILAARFGALVETGRGRADRTAAEAGDVEAQEYDDAVLRWPTLDVRCARGVTALMAGDSRAAVADLGHVWEFVQNSGIAEPGAFPITPDLVEALVATGDIDRAVRVAASLDPFPDHAWAVPAAHRCRGHLALAGLNGDDPVSCFLQAADGHQHAGFRFDHARCLVLAGAAARARRQVRIARRWLEAGVAAFEELGSPGWQRWAAAELARLGGRRAPGPELTEAEAQVATLVAAGRRNREVAAELFISESTVEATLTRIYTKLGIRSRVELATRLRGPSTG